MTDFLKPLSVESMFAAYPQEIDTIRTAAGFSRSQFDASFLPVLYKYAECVQNLPLSTQFYHKPGGAWEFGLFVSILTLRVAESRMFFPSLDSIERRTLEKESLFAAFAAGLATGIAVLAQNTRISAENDHYHILTSPKTLREYLITADQPAFEWRTEEPPLTNTECAAIGARFLPFDKLHFFDLRIIRSIYGAIYPQSAPNAIETTLSRVVRQSTDRAIQFYLDKFAAQYNPDLKSASAPTAAEAAEVAQDMITTSQAVPTTNALDDDDAPASGAAPAAQSFKPNAAASPAPATANPARPAATPRTPGNPVTLGAKPQAFLSPRPADAVTGEIEMTAEDYMNAAPQELKEWFLALWHHERYDAFQKSVVIGPTGIEVPLGALGSLGLQAKTVTSMMREAGMFIGLTKDGARAVVQHAIKPLILKEKV